MWSNWSQMGPWSMILGWLFVILLLVGLVVLLIVLVRLLSSRGAQKDSPPGSGRAPARDILDERYARGEIDDLEYENRRRRLDNISGHEL